MMYLCYRQNNLLFNLKNKSYSLFIILLWKGIKKKNIKAKRRGTAKP